MTSMEDFIQNAYIQALQPVSLIGELATPKAVENIETTINVASDVGKQASESFKEYTNAAASAIEQNKGGEFAIQSLGALGKGMAQGVGGIAGDIESIVRGLYATAQTPEGQSKLQALGKAMQDETFFTSSEDMARHLKSLGIPDSPKGMEFVEGAGNILAPIGTAAKVVQKGAKAIKSTKGVK
jgi:hypothetical protein